MLEPRLMPMLKVGFIGNITGAIYSMAENFECDSIFYPIYVIK